jgi:hypothetical protein
MNETPAAGHEPRWTNRRSDARWPLVFRSLGQSLQGPRLLVALALVIVMMACGAIWDSVSPARVGPEGIGSLYDSEVVHAQLRERIQSDDWQRALDDEDRENLLERELLTPGAVRQTVAHRYQARRGTLSLELIDADEAQAERKRRRLEREREAADQIIVELEALAPRGVFSATIHELRLSGGFLIESFWTLSPWAAGAGIRDFFARIHELLITLWAGHPVFVSSFGVILLLIHCIGGTALARMTARDMVGGEIIRPTQALGYSIAKCRDSVTAMVLFPLVAVILAAIVLGVGGVVLRIPGLNILGGLVYGLLILLSLIAVLIAVGFVGAVSLMIPAVAVDNADGFDAQQRAYAYLISRPARLLLYTLLALVQAAIAVSLIWFIANVTLGLTASLTEIIGGDAAQQVTSGAKRLTDHAPTWELSMTQSLAAGLIDIWTALLGGLVAAFGVSFYYASQTIIYLLMRWAVDGQAIEEHHPMAS